jgi:hypothetical protein
MELRANFIFISLSMALQPFVGPWPLFQFLDLFTQSVGLLGRGLARRKADTCTQNKRTQRHPHLEWNSNQ